MHFEFDMKAINLIAKNNCLDKINWPNHLRVIKVLKFTKAKSQQNSQTGFMLKKEHYNVYNDNRHNGPQGADLDAIRSGWVEEKT